MAADGSLSIQMINAASAQLGQHSTVPNLGLVTKDGEPVPITNSFLAAGAVGSDQLTVGVAAADGTLLTVQGQSVVSGDKTPWP